MSQRISDMTAASALTGAEIFPVVQGGNNRRTTTGAVGSTRKWRQVSLDDVVVTGTVTPTSIVDGGSFTIPADTLVIGDCVHLFATGYCSMLDTDYFTVSFGSAEAGAILVGNVFTGTTITDLGWTLWGLLTVRESGLAIAGGFWLGVLEAVGSIPKLTPFSLTLSDDLVGDITVELANTDPSLSVTCQQMELWV